MHRTRPEEHTVAELDLTGMAGGTLLQPMEPVRDDHRRFYETWETPLAPWGGFRLDSGLSVARDGERNVLAFVEDERAIVAGSPLMRDCRIVAELRPQDVHAGPNADCARPRDALVGIVFRLQTSRWYYQFGIEGARRAVLYRRKDDEWHVLAEQDVNVPDGYVTLEVALDGDAMTCRCEPLGVHFFCTDTTFPTGKAGVRSLGGSVLASLRILQTDGQRARDERSRRSAQRQEEARGEGVPDGVLATTMDLAALGGAPSFHDFAEPGRYDMLVETKTGLRAMTVAGDVLWEVPERIRGVVYARDHGPDGRLLYGFAGVRGDTPVEDVRGRPTRYTVSDEMVVLRGRDGTIVARAPLPPAVETQRFFDYSPTSAAFTGAECTDIVLREWRDDKGGGGVRLWAHDKDMDLLWRHEQPGAYYGHHWALALCDIDGDGRDELLAGGTLYDGEGSILWTHDRADEVFAWHGGDHYDAVALGALAGDEETDPVAILLAGSAGVYVVDALTGRTRAVHRVGHAQGRYVGKLRADIPGQQVLVATRWGNMGILTLFSGRGERLWTIQPDYVGQGSCPVTWGGADAQLIWTNTTGAVQALYDGYGRRVKPLPELSAIWDGCAVREVQSRAIRMGTDPTEYLALTCEDTLHVFGPEA